MPVPIAAWLSFHHYRYQATYKKIHVLRWKCLDGVKRTNRAHTRMHICTRTCAHTCTRACTYAHALAHAHAHMHTHAHTYTHMHMHMYMQTMGTSVISLPARSKWVTTIGHVAKRLIEIALRVRDDIHVLDTQADLLEVSVVQWLLATWQP